MRWGRAVWLALAVAFGLGGCTRVYWTPYSTMSVKPKVAKWSIPIHLGDLQYLQAASPEIVGYIRTEGPNGVGRIRAGEMATMMGGTHHILESSDVYSEQYRYAPATAQTTYAVQNGYRPQLVATTTYNEGIGTRRVYTGRYVVFRVDPARWGYLPPPLIPHRAGR